MPQKNGNVYWSLLLHKVLDPSTNFELPRSGRSLGFHKKLELSNKNERTWYDWLDGASVPRFMIVRNPYVRLLSGYLDKVDSELGREKLARNFGIPPPANFESFVRWLHKYMKGRDKGASPANFWVRHIFMPQASHCLLPCGVQYTVVKVEESNRWYPCFLDAMNLSSAASSGWGGQSCFLSREGKCNTSMWTDTNCAQRTSEVTKGTVHSKNTEELMEKHYTPAVAKQVTDLYLEDISTFGYQVWDGNIDNFQRS